MDPYSRFPRLNTFLGGVLHEDWTDEFNSWPEALQSWLDASYTTELADFLGELDALLGGDDVESVLAALCVGLSPEGDLQLSGRDWLMSVRVQASRALDSRRRA